jgi:hypothetical protein
MTQWNQRKLLPPMKMQKLSDSKIPVRCRLKEKMGEMSRMLTAT